MADVTLPNMGLVQPSLGGSSGTWGTSINNNIGALDEHDHTAAKGVQIPVAGLDMDDDLSFAGLHGPVHCFRVNFDEIAGISIPARSFYVKSSDHELYFKSTGLADIKLTSGGDLNLSGTGGFIGDYAGSGAKASFDTALNEFKFTDSANRRSQIQCGGVKLVERDANESFGVTLQCPAALVTGYGIVMPLALPATTQLVRMNSAGVLSVGAATVAAVSGYAINAATNNGYADPIGFIPASWKPSGAAKGFLTLMLNAGARVTSMTFATIGNAAADMTVACYVQLSAGPMGVPTAIGTVTLTNPAAAWAETTINVTDTTLAVGDAFIVVFDVNAAGIEVGNIRLTNDGSP